MKINYKNMAMQNMTNLIEVTKVKRITAGRKVMSQFLTAKILQKFKLEMATDFQKATLQLMVKTSKLMQKFMMAKPMCNSILLMNF